METRASLVRKGPRLPRSDRWLSLFACLLPPRAARVSRLLARPRSPVAMMAANSASASTVDSMSEGEWSIASKMSERSAGKMSQRKAV